MGYFYCRSPPRRSAMASAGGEKAFDPVVFDVTRIPPEDIASQITLDDFNVFVKIKPDELISTAWEGRQKTKICPYIVELTQRFNRSSFWCMNVILQARNNKLRSEYLSCFISIAKRLHELSNYHGMLAIVSALRHPAICRLTDTWKMVSRRESQNLQYLEKFVPEDDGRAKLQSLFEKIKLPCIPHLGLYLKQLVYIDAAHPVKGGLESESRMLKINNILRIISEFQKSDYSHLQPLSHIQSYLKTFNYHHELQRFLEDENYKQSYNVQPRVCDDIATKNAKFHRGHRRTLSLGRPYSPRRETVISISLLDDQPLSPIIQSPINGIHTMPPYSNGSDNRISHSYGSGFNSSKHQPPRSLPSTGSSDLSSVVGDMPLFRNDIPQESRLCCGCLFRKKTIKKGKTVAIKWPVRYYVILMCSSDKDGFYGDSLMLLYPSRIFPLTRSTNESDYKTESTKQIILSRFVFSAECPEPTDFSLTNSESGDSYRFTALDILDANRWKNAIRKATRPRIPDLIQFDQTEN